MKSFVSLILILLYSSNGNATDIVKLSGAIGTYEIEMELEKSSDKESSLQGSYKYKGKTSFLILKGNFFGSDIIKLSEYSKDKSTGEFYLVEEENSKWIGYWIGEDSHYEVELNLISGDMAIFDHDEFQELAKNCNSSITGSYAMETYFLNDMWLDQDGQVEVGFNGGLVTVEEISSDTIKIQFELLCGPTYHMAFFHDFAIKNEEGVYVFNQSFYDDDELCHLLFEFNEKEIVITQKSPGMNCDFGMRAYADGNFIKINDKVVEGETITIGDAIKLK